MKYSLSVMLICFIMSAVYAINNKLLYLRSMKLCILRSSGNIEYTKNIISIHSIDTIRQLKYVISFYNNFKFWNVRNSKMKYALSLIFLKISKQIVALNWITHSSQTIECWTNMLKSGRYRDPFSKSLYS